MENFIYYNPTSLHFGKGVVNRLGFIINGYGKKAMLVYGKGSVKNSGAYSDVITQLEKQNIEYIEYAGIKSNPIVEDIDKAADLAKENNVDFIIGIGGGSVIDSAKIISVVAKSNNKAWDFISYKAKPNNSLPLIAVLTLAATGTEMNNIAVAQNDELKVKGALVSAFIYPKHSFLDPSYTLTVPYNYTSYGIADVIAHSFEAYFGGGEAQLSDKIVFSIVNEMIEIAPSLLNNLQDYELRARMMYASTLALNGLTSYGRIAGDWGVHSIGHCLSVLYDIPHGASLSIVYPAWLKMIKNTNPDRIKTISKAIFKEEDIDVFISKLEDFYKSINSPVRLADVNIGTDKNEEILSTLIKNGVGGSVYRFNQEQLSNLVNLMN